MLSSILELFKSEKPDATLSADDARLALAALMVRIARTDNEYAADEIAAIDARLSHRYGLNAIETVTLRGEAETLEAQAPDTVRFTRTLKDAIAYEEREAVVKDLWHIVLADGERAHEEDALMRMTAKLLGVSDRHSAHARQEAQSEL